MLVSCLMPTTDSRKELRKLAIKCFNSQDWEEKELIVIEGNDPIGTKLNQACSQAKGDILVRWDDDDWSAPNRISEQLKLLGSYQMTGYHTMFFWDIILKRASIYKGARDYCLGTSMCFTRKYWDGIKFPDISMGEDLAFQKKARAEKAIISIEANQMMVARLHGKNTGSNRHRFPEVAKEKLPNLFWEE